MTTARKNAGRAKSIPGGMFLAVCVSMLITVFISAILAGYLHREKITWQQAGYWIMGMLFAASFIGGKCAIAAIKRQRILICVMTGILYWGILLCMTALFFGGNFDAIWETAGIIGAGVGSAALLCVPEYPKYRKKARRAHG